MPDTDFYIKEGDTSPAIQYQLQDEDGDAIVLTGITNLRFIMSLPGAATAKVSSALAAGFVSVVNATTGIVKYLWQTGDTDTRGLYRAEWEVTYSDGTVETFPNDSYIWVEVLGDLG